MLTCSFRIPTCSRNANRVSGIPNNYNAELRKPRVNHQKKRRGRGFHGGGVVVAGGGGG